VTRRPSPEAQETNILVDGITFLVPSRNFRIEGTLLKAGYVNLATEFALRLVRDAGQLPPAEIGAFFGFSERETRAVIQELLLDADGVAPLRRPGAALATRGGSVRPSDW
jgi:hypothetical protein